MRFADFYAGGGGWSLGLSLAQMEPVFSAEIWPIANKTREWNFGSKEVEIDIRELDPASVPDCDVIVGSPPCTQFSYANKGGNGDLKDGMVDVRSFLRIVQLKKPRYWVMENVPRLAPILEEELKEGGALAEFSNLFSSIDVFDMSEWGVPQRRKRCIAGNYPRQALMALRGRRAPTLQDVLVGCSEGIDPVWGYRHLKVTDNSPGASLTWEEERINYEKKRNHPIYNDMSFPDSQTQIARTITATCTNVSRESIVVADGSNGHRLLTAREMAAIQSFPLNYQFPAKSQSDRVKMAGNAIPPLFTYFFGLACKGEKLPETMPSFAPAFGSAEFVRTASRNRIARNVPRSFRAAVSRLRFKSGMSFEVNNAGGLWKMVFNMGGPGRVETLSEVAISEICRPLPLSIYPQMPKFNVEEIQACWQNSCKSESHPFVVIDAIERLIPSVQIPDETAALLLGQAYAFYGKAPPEKARRFQREIATGLVLANAFNSALSKACGV